MPNVGDTIPLSQLGNLSNTAVGQSVPLSQLSGASPVSTSSASKPDSFLTMATKATGSVANFFVGGASDLGTHLGEGAAALTGKAATAITGNPSLENSINAKLQQPQTNLFGAPVTALKTGAAGVEQLGGDALKTGAQAGTFLAAPETLAGSLGAGAVLGGAIGAGDAMQNNGSLGDVAMNASIDAAAGGVLGGAGAALGKVLPAGLSALPNRLTRSVLPKLEPGNEAYALANTRVGSIGTLLDDSKSAVSNLGQQIQTILTHPDYASHTGQGDQAIKQTLAAFPNSKYTPESVITTIQELVPGQTKLVDKVADGTATLQEKNALRMSIDPIIKKVFTDNPQVSSAKQIGAQFANALRGEVQKEAPETQSVFAKLSQEINLRNALTQAKKTVDNSKTISLKDILSYMTLGLSGLAGEKAASSPGVALTAAKGASRFAAGAAKLAPLAKALRLPVSTGAINASQSGTTGQTTLPQ